MTVWGPPARLVLAGAFLLTVAACAPRSGPEAPAAGATLAMGSKDPEDCRIEAEASTRRPAVPVFPREPDRNTIRAFESPECGRECARKRARAHEADLARQAAEAQSEARYRETLVRRTTGCLLSGGCLRRLVFN